jgi:hypothetical protein
MRLPGLADVFERAQQIYHSRVKRVIPMFLGAPRILEAESADEVFLNTHGLSNGR